MRRGWPPALVVVLGAVLLCTSAASAALAPSQVRVGAPPSHPSRSRVLGALSSSTQIQISVTLKPRDPAALAAYAAAVSTPGSSAYHHYLTVGQFRQRFGPSQSQIGAVESSLRAHGLNPGSVSANGLEVPVSDTAGAVEHGLSLSFQRVALASGRTAYANTQAPQFDSSVASAVQSVVGLDSLTVPQPQGIEVAHGETTPSPQVLTGGPQPCNTAVQGAPENDAYTADQIASAYQFSSLYQAGDEGAGQTIALFELEPNRPSDIAAYQSCYGTSTSVSYVSVDGGAGSGAGQGEAALDIEDVIGLAPKANVLVYQGPNSGDGAYLTYSAIVSQDRAQVISTSWGACEAYEQGSSTAEAENTLFQEAAAQGQSVFAAAGDSGSEDCQTSSLAVDDPASQPYVTGVGGTTLSTLGPPPVQTVWNESTQSGGGGGGGISSVWPMPSYQSGAPQSLNVINGSSSGTPCGAGAGDYCREVPDVSADADPYTGYLIYWRGSWSGIGGTSAAAPLWAAFMALVNASSSCNGTPVGFANPALYTAAANDYSGDFSDITSGNNDYAGDNNGTFAAGTGYDMASGLGTPIGSTLPAALCGQDGGSGDTISVANPGSQTSSVDSAPSLQISASDSASGATVTYSAAGLPAGLSIDSSTGLISGAPTAPGGSTVTVSATDTGGGSGSATFSWTVVPRQTATTVACSPSSVVDGVETMCTATASDVDAGYASAPTGTVSFSSSATGSFSGGGSCALVQTSGDVASCAVSYEPLVTGTPEITADYSGDGVHRPSAAGLSLSVSVAPPAQAASSSSHDSTAPAVGSVLSCPSGFTGSVSYQWSRDGTPIVGATSSRYTVQTIDEGTTLTCVVRQAGATGSTLGSASVSIPVNAIAGCPAATGKAQGTTLGLISLGMTRKQAQRAYARSADHATTYQDLFCLTPAGIRAGYATPKLLGVAPRAARKSLQGRVIWISTQSAYYAIDGIRVGAKLSAAARRLKLGPAFLVHGARWYFAPTGGATAVLQVRGGIVQEIAIATRTLTQGRSAQRGLVGVLA